MNTTASIDISTPHVYEKLFYSWLECRAIGMTLVLFSVIGSIANVAVILVYILKQSKSSYEVFVLSLAVINLAGTGLLMPVECVSVWFTHDRCNQPSDWLTLATTLLECGSILALLAVAVDRYCCICLASRVSIRPAHAKAAVAASHVCVAAAVFTPKLVGSDETRFLHFIYPVCALIVLLSIIVLYSLVFLKVHRTAAQYQKNRQKESQKLQLECRLNDQRPNSGVPHLAVSNRTEDSSQSSAVAALIAARGSFQVTEMSNVDGPHQLLPRHRNTDDQVSNDSTIVSVGCCGLTSTSKDVEKCVLDEMKMRTALILVCITICYVINFVPTSLINLVFYFRPDALHHLPTKQALVVKYAQMLYYLNFVLTPIIYSVFSEAFRKDWFLTSGRLRRRLTLIKNDTGSRLI